MTTDPIRDARTIWAGEYYRVYALFVGGYKVEQHVASSDTWIFVDRLPEEAEALRLASLLEAREIARRALGGT